MLRAAVPLPCICCNATELRVLAEAAAGSSEANWKYTAYFDSRCGRCDSVHIAGDRYSVRCLIRRVGDSLGLGAVFAFCNRRHKTWRVMLLGYFISLVARAVWARKRKVSIALPETTVGTIQRAIEASAIAEKGSKHRAHGTFIHHLQGLEISESLKIALEAWAPSMIGGFMYGEPVHRELLQGKLSQVAKEEISVDTHKGNEDIEEGGQMLGTQLKGDEYGEEDRVRIDEAECLPPEPKPLAANIGPDVQATEVMDSTAGNLKAGVAKRVQPLPFLASKNMIGKIRRTVDAVMKQVFSKEAIRAWREKNPDLSEMASKKWSQDRFARAWDDVLADMSVEIQQEFQIKTNEALPAKGKAPRPIIQTGDKGQVLMMLPVKCFEDLLFDYFEQASIKHCPKDEAMKRVADHLRQGKKVQTIEGDGSAWDSCCNKEVRDLTENRVIAHIIEVLGFDGQVPQVWMDAMLKDMRKQRIHGKTKIRDFCLRKCKVNIDSIRQSGHRGTSAFNWFVNFILWLCVIADNPWDLIGKDEQGKLFKWYKSSSDQQWHTVKYAFEGDDSVLTTSEQLNPLAVEEIWASLGFRMKLVFGKDWMTFTGFNFLCDANGPQDIFLPEIARNIASASWSCSAVLKQDMKQVHQIGAAAMLARAENFRNYPPLSVYFAALGLAHSRVSDDFPLDEKEAMNLGIKPVPSVVDALHDLANPIGPIPRKMRSLVEKVCGVKFTHEEVLNMLRADFDSPFDTHRAMITLPRALWGTDDLESPRR